MENWRAIEWYIYYEVSNWGKVRSLDRIITVEWNKRIVKWKVLKNGRKWVYSKVDLYKNWKPKTFTVHRLVAQAFLWLNINNSKVFVCHESEELTEWLLDNSLDNLWLWNHKLNMEDMSKKWRFIKDRPWKKVYWKDNKTSKKVNQYTLDWEFIKTWDSMADILRELKVSAWNICQCCTWKRNKASGFIWKYTDCNYNGGIIL